MYFGFVVTYSVPKFTVPLTLVFPWGALWIRPWVDKAAVTHSEQFNPNDFHGKVQQEVTIEQSL